MTQENLLARYSVLHEIGRGASTRVYAARDRESGATVALKRLDPAASKSDAGLAQRFVQAARSARKLKHDNIVQVYDAGEAAGTAYVAMEMLEGRSLRDLLDEGPLPLTRAIRIAREIASGLACAHLAGVVHGALKPSNILVTRSGAVKITDFGTGRLEKAAPTYLSPEQLSGDPADHRSDLFSLGAVLYEMLTQRALQGDSLARPSELNPNVPRALDAIVFRLLAPKPAARMAGAPILIRDLQRLEESLGLGGAQEPAPAVQRAQPEAASREAPDHKIADPDALDFQKAIALMEAESKAPPRSRSRPALFAVLALLLAALGVGLGWYYSPELLERGIAALRGFTPTQSAPAPVAEANKEPAKAPEPPPAQKAPEQTAPPEAKPIPAAAEPEQSASAGASAPIEQEPKPVAAAELPDPAPAPPPEPLPAKQPAPTVAKQQRPAGTAKLIVTVSPRGDLYIDGTHHGSTPPLTTFELQPGLHRIEVRNPTRKPYVTYMTVEAGEVRRITHDFDAKLRPPS